MMSALACTSFMTSPCALRNGRVGRACGQALVVAPPRKQFAAWPGARSINATVAAMPVTSDAIVAPAKVVHVLTADKYQEFLTEHSDKLITMDFYAVWCGPCKMIAPELERMAAESDPSKLVFAKLDCGADNDSKKLAMSLGIKALPTFHLYRNSKLVDSMTGAKVKSLQELISKHL